MPAHAPDSHGATQTHDVAPVVKSDAEPVVPIPGAGPRIDRPAYFAEDAVASPLGVRPAADSQGMVAEPPVVRIVIGRIEVRVTQPMVPARQPAARPAAGMSLDAYLQRREGSVR